MIDIDAIQKQLSEDLETYIFEVDEVERFQVAVRGEDILLLHLPSWAYKPSALPEETYRLLTKHIVELPGGIQQVLAFDLPVPGYHLERIMDALRLTPQSLVTCAAPGQESQVRELLKRYDIN